MRTGSVYPATESLKVISVVEGFQQWLLQSYLLTDIIFSLVQFIASYNVDFF